VLSVGLLTTMGSVMVLWLAARVVPDGDGDTVADAVELLKVALAVGMSRWAASFS